MANQVPESDVIEVVLVVNNNVPVATGAIEVVSVANNIVPAATGAEVVVDAEVVIGEPPEITDIDIQGSVCYTHRYFKKIAGTDTAVCLTCQRFNAKRGAKDVKRKDTFSTAGGSTPGEFLKVSEPLNSLNFILFRLPFPFVLQA